MNRNKTELFINIIENNNEIIIREENEQIQISTLKSQKESINYTSIDLGPCEEKLRKAYNISENEELIIFKIEHYLPNLKIPIIDFILFNQNGSLNLNLSHCSNQYIQYSIPINIEENEEYKYDPNSNYYNDKCDIENEDNNLDMTLYEKRNTYNKNNMSLCEADCLYKGYDFDKKKAKCECPIKNNVIHFMNLTIDTDKLIYKFKNIKSITNINIIKCYKILLSKENLIYNIGSYILLIIIFVSFILSFVFCCKSRTQLINKIKYNYTNVNTNVLSSFKKNNNYNNNYYRKGKINNRTTKRIKGAIRPIKNPLKKKTIPKENRNKKIILNSSKSNLMKLKNRKRLTQMNLTTNNKKDKPRNIKQNNIIKYNGYEMNILPYKLAKIYDNRSFCVYYCSLIGRKQIIAFTFITKDDYNSRIIKINLFLFSVALYFCVNALFFTDSTMHEIFINKGEFNLIYQLPQIIYSSLISSIINVSLKSLALTENRVIEIKEQKKRNNKLNVTHKSIQYFNCKFFMFYFLDFLLLFFFWYYLSCFCALYKNTQLHLIKDTLISFGISLIIPFFINIIPGICRIPSLKNKKQNHEGLYKISKVFQFIL